MTGTSGATTPAGWYPDPAGSGHLRWWDGTVWTAHLAPQPTPEPTPQIVAPAPVVPTPRVQEPVIQPPVFQPATAVQAPVFAQTDGILSSPPDQPYSPAPDAWNSAPSNAWGTLTAEDFARPAQWNTVSVWLLAFMALIDLVAEFIFLLVVGVNNLTPTQAGARVGLTLVLYVIPIFLASVDRRKLRSLGYVKPASVWWSLLGPLFYLIFRAVAVSREVRHGFAPLITYIVVTVVSGVLFGVALVGLVVADNIGGISSTAFARSLQVGLDEKGGNFTVTCPPTITEVVGSTFSCTAVDDTTKTSHTLNIEVITGADGKPTVKLISVVPEISG
jgi:Protein of unknown function (DUF2510)